MEIPFTGSAGGTGHRGRVLYDDLSAAAKIFTI
jgi:hypothetical protein